MSEMLNVKNPVEGFYDNDGQKRVVPIPEDILAAGGSIADFLREKPIGFVIDYYIRFVESSVHMPNSVFVPREGDDDNTAKGIKALWLAFTGLAGESTEVLALVGDVEKTEPTTFVDRVVEECGDVFWYFFLLAFNLHVKPDAYTHIVVNDNQRIVFEGVDWELLFMKALYDNRDGDYTDTDCAVHLVIAAGKMLEICKKAMIHGRMSNLSPQYIEDVIVPLMRDAFQMTVLIANQYSNSIHDVLVKNMEKLTKRRAEKAGAFAATEVVKTS